MSTVQAEIEAIDQQIEELRRQKAALKLLPVEPQDTILNWTVRAELADGTQTSWQVYAVKGGEYWTILDTRSGARVGQNAAHTWQALTRAMQETTYKNRYAGDGVTSIDISGPYVANEWVPVA